jgi:hypothetical protein
MVWIPRGGRRMWIQNDTGTEQHADRDECDIRLASVFFFLADSGQVPLFYPQIGHKYLNL